MSAVAENGAPATASVRWRAWWTPAIFLLFAALWTWPAPVTGALLGRRADALGTVWFVSAAARLLPGLHDPLTGWPLGADYTRPDSFTLLLLGPLSAILGAARLSSWVAWLGSAASAWAAETLARSLGATAPWSLVAGLGFAFAGLGSTAWIEGYTYHLADPWLPLFTLWWLRALGAEGRPRDGLYAAGFFALALATSAWHGLAAAILAVGLLLAARARGDLQLRPILAAGAVVAGVGAAYAASFFGHAPASEAAATGFGGLSTLGERLLLHTAPGPAVDIDGRGQSAWFSSAVLAGFLVAPLVLARDWRLRALGLTAAAALFLALVPLPWNFIVEYSPASRAGAVAALRAAFGRFPERLGWAWLLGASTVAACVFSELHARGQRGVWALLAVAAIEPFWALGLPGRQMVTPSAAPSAYAASTGPVLDLWPEDLTSDPGWELRVTNTDCFYQANHHRALGELCLLVPGQESPRARLAAWTTDALLAGRGDEVRTRLHDFGYTTLAWHPDVFRLTTRERLHEALVPVDGAPTESTDAGDHVLAYALGEGASEADATAAWAAWVSG